MDSYQKTIGARIKTNLNQRAKHMGYTELSDDPFGASASQLYQKANLQEKGSLVDTNQFKASQTIKRQNTEEDSIESNFESVDETPDNVKEDNKVENINTDEETIQQKDEFKEFDELDEEFSIEDEFESAKNNKNQNKLSPPNYSQIAQKVKVRKSGIKKK